MKNIVKTILFASILLLSQALFAQINHFTFSGSGYWEDPINWADRQLPSSSINADVTVVINGDCDATHVGIMIKKHGEMIISSGGKFKGSVDVKEGGQLKVDGLLDGNIQHKNVSLSGQFHGKVKSS